jgi:hypothetical protein
MSSWLDATLDEKNSSCIMDVSPKAPCAGEEITISASPERPFDSSRPPDTGVVFGCEVIVTAPDSIEWTKERVKVRVPEAARSGSVYFAHTQQGTEVQQLAEIAMNNLSSLMQSVLGANREGLP